MTNPHPFRLKGPWQFTAHNVQDHGSKPLEYSEIDGPGSWGSMVGERFCGQVKLVRRFGRPSNVEIPETVWLVVDDLPQGSSVTLNGRPMGLVAGGPRHVEWEVTDRLAARNELCIEFTVAEGQPAAVSAQSTPSEVRLEVRRLGG